MVVNELVSQSNGGTKLLPDNNQQVLGKDDFLNLLVAQLQYQDPLNPMDSTQFTSQLAQFSSLEQLSNINTQLQSLQTQQQENSNAQSMGYIGKTVLADGNGLWLAAEGEARLGFNLASDIAAAQVNIYDATGEYVRTLETAALSSGDQFVAWDGKDGAGYRLESGRYSFEVLAADGDGNMVAATPLVSARVTGVQFKNAVPQLVTAGELIPVYNVRQVTE